MGKVKNFLDKPTFTYIQKLIFDEFSKNKSLRKQFYFTGGTALSAFYLHHRESEDLDFFSERDFVDLFFLLKEFTFWDLVHAVKQKFNLDEDIVLLGSNFLKVEQFDVLPKMLIPLTLKKLQDFFKEQAKKIGMRVVK